MGYITHIFVTLALISVLSCAPVDDSPSLQAAKSATTVSAIPPATPTTEQSSNIKKQTQQSKSGSSDESKDSDESFEEPNKRPTRDSEHSAVVLAQQTKTYPAAPATTDVPKLNLPPARQTRDTSSVPAAAVAATFADASTSSTPASTSASYKYSQL